MNVSIDERAKVLPNNQKAVLNAISKLEFDISDGKNGYRHLSMDNRYACPELTMILRDQCSIYSTGTVIINRKGFPRDIFTFTKSNEKGDYKIAYDKVKNCLLEMEI